MDIVSGASFYDSLNKLIIGFLLLLPSIGNCYTLDNYELMLLGVACWVTGLFFWGLIDRVVCSNIICPLLENNYVKWIRESYEEIMDDKLSTDDSKEIKDKYYEAYYSVQEHGLLGAVNRLESFSAFFRNIFFVMIIWIFITICRCCCLPLYFGKICVCSCFDSCSCGSGCLQISPCCAIIFFISIAILSLCLRRVVEKLIQRSVLEAYKYLTNKTNK